AVIEKWIEFASHVLSRRLAFSSIFSDEYGVE
ncbi:hypothetical protein A2U01_0043062, partial [Trifolium medium]|nr:hypothetical protein [Trifolium medium]